MNWIPLTLHHALAMLWMTFWALVLGFSVSAALQVFVSKDQMSRAFGRTNLKTVGLAMGLGAASSSCSYAAAAAGRSAIKQGAAFVPAIAFMFASTNLVIEMGIVLWMLMGWHFVLAEFLGAFVLVGVVWLLVRLFLPRAIEEEAKRKAGAGEEDDCCHSHSHHGARGGRKQMAAPRFRVPDGLADVVEGNSRRFSYRRFSERGRSDDVVESALSRNRERAAAPDRKRARRVR